MEMVLIRERLWSIVCERRTKPESGAKAQADFEDDTERATATIFLHLSAIAERYVQDLRDPVLIWKKLKEAFEAVGFTARYNLWKRLFNIKIKESQSIVDYLDDIREVSIRLRECGVNIMDEILVTIALQGIGSEFDALIAVITHKEKPTFDELTALLTEEISRKGLTLSGSRSYQETVLQVGERKPGVCWHCGKPGHKKDRCFELHPEMRTQAPSTGPLPTPSGGRGLSPGPEKSMRSKEAEW